MKRLCVFLIATVHFSLSYSQNLRLNEFYPGDQGLTPNDSLSGHWVEFFNDSDTVLQAGDYSLRIMSNAAWKLPLDVSDVSPATHLVQPLDISFRIGDVLQLYRSDSVLVDSLTISALTPWQSLASVPDGVGDWHVVNQDTQGGPNYPDFPDADAVIDDWIKYGTGPFTIRDGAGAVVFNGHMWILSGWEHGPLSQEIWRSKNGLDWELVTMAPWPGRHQAGFVVFDNKMWVISGDLISDVWNSVDGIDWELVTDNAPWGERYAPYVVAYDGRIWLMGGINYPLTEEGLYDFHNPNQFNDVWSTTNGRDWALVTEHAGWAPRSMILGSVVFDNKMWIMGGGVKGYGSTISEYNDVWNSTDGVTWTQVTDSAGWDPRIHMSTIVYDQRIWVTDGSPGEPWVLTNEVWSSVDGAHWQKQETPTRWRARHATSVFNFDGSLWMIAGFNNNDVWRYTAPLEAFYSSSSGDIADPQNWGTMPDGSGATPLSFAGGNQIFVLTNRDSVTLQRDLAVTGVGSKFIVGNHADRVVLEVPSNIHLDATIEVGAGSSLIMRSSDMPEVAKLGMNSKVVFQAESDFLLPPAAYYDLEIESTGNVTVSGDVAVYGTLSCLSGSLASDSLNPIRLYGDLFVANKGSVEKADFRFMGSENQKLDASESLVLNAAKMHKTGGELWMAGRTEVRQSLTVRFNNAATLRISASLGLKGRAVLEGDLTQVDIPGEVILREGLFQFRRLRFANLKFERREGQVQFVDSDFTADNLSVYTKVRDIADGSASTVTVSQSLSIDNASGGDVNFGRLKLVTKGSDDVLVSSNTTATVHLSKVAVDLPNSGTLGLSASVKIRDEIALHSGKIRPVHPFTLTYSDSMLLRFTGSEPQMVTDFSVDSVVKVRHFILSNSMGVSQTTDMVADTVSLVHGNLINLEHKLFTNKIRTFNPHSSLIINDGGTLITNASTEQHFLPLAFDSVKLPIKVSIGDAGQVSKLSVRLQKVNIHGALRYAWLIENLSDPDKLLDVTFFWPKKITPAQQSADHTKISLISTFDYEIHDFHIAEEPSAEFFSKASSLSLSEALVIITEDNDDAPELGVNLFPNPAVGTATVTLSRLTPGRIRMALFTSHGALHTSQEISMAAGQQIFRFPHLPTGLYVLKVDDGQTSETIRFTVL